jgi:hypothetical protein
MWYAQEKNVVDCTHDFGGGDPMLDATGQPLTSPVTGQNIRGYELMSLVFYNGYSNDGYAWHNYWNLGKEPWAACDGSPDQGMHVSMYFPSAMQSALAAKRSDNKPSFILEADLSSSLQNWGNPLNEKDLTNGYDAKGSLDDFLQYEQLADYAAVWNLNADDGNNEQKWHQGYARTSPTCYLIRIWFARWWLNTNEPITACSGSAALIPFIANGDEGTLGRTTDPTPTLPPYPLPPTPTPATNPTGTSTPGRTPPPTHTPTPTHTPSPNPALSVTFK